MLTLDQLVSVLDPSRTVLFMGAGASIPSGAPAGAELAKTLCKRLAGEILSEDLTEAASILEYRYGRAALIAAIRELLGSLQPTAGLAALPAFDWHSIYTTNFDDLLEKAYRNSGKPFVVTLSNYDFGENELKTGVQIYKIHGSLTSDLIDGNKFGMVLTESDYDTSAKYREALFRNLSLQLLTKDVLIVGYALRDPDLHGEMVKAAELHREQSTPAHLYALIYTADQDRAALLERRGFQVTFGGIDEFAYNLTNKPGSKLPTSVSVAASPGQLPPSLQTVVIDVDHARSLQANPVRLYHGAAATYADIASGLTFARAVEPQAVGQLEDPKKPFVAIVGVEGVGKSSLARRLLLELHGRGFLAWEHRVDFPFSARPWIQLERQLRQDGLKGVLLVDDCPPFLAQVNALCDSLGSREEPSLRLVLTARRSDWIPRVKSPQLFNRGEILPVSQLTEPELGDLVNLVERQPQIRRLVDRPFLQQSRQDQVSQLRRRCGADMFVCLKNIFANEDLDTILLREYANLRWELQEIYRYVAALEAAGARVHRQLVVRLLGINVSELAKILELTEGIVDEYDIDPSDGIYGWRTRHQVIARTIASYKFSEQDELYQLFERVIDGLVPTIPLEMRTLRDICNVEYGIGQIQDANQVNLKAEALMVQLPRFG